MPKKFFERINKTKHTKVRITVEEIKLLDNAERLFLEGFMQKLNLMTMLNVLHGMGLTP